MKSGIELIAEERKEQMEKHGRTHVSDVRENWDAQLSTAAGMLAYQDIDELNGRDAPPTNWDLATWQKMWDKPYFERLKIAGALIAAELDRLILEDLVNVQQHLPDHYELKMGTTTNQEKKSMWIRCMSRTGIQKDGNDDNEAWEKFFQSMKNYFGDRFIEIYHNTCTWHVDFVIYYREREIE